MSRLLRFVVEQALHGSGDDLKEYSVGVEVFDNDRSFDSRIDNNVRTEARRLRAKLVEASLGASQQRPAARNCFWRGARCHSLSLFGCKSMKTW